MLGSCMLLHHTEQLWTAADHEAAAGEAWGQPRSRAIAEGSCLWSLPACCQTTAGRCDAAFGLVLPLLDEAIGVF